MRVWAVLAVLAGVAAALSASPASAKHSFPAHRVLQWDKDGAQLGSRRAMASLQASATPRLLGLQPQEGRRRGPGDLKGRMAVVRARDASAALVEEVVDLRGASGVMLLLPSDPEAAAAGGEDAAARAAELEQLLVSRTLDIPVYVAVEDEAVSAMYESVEASGGEGAADLFQIEVPGTEAKPLKTVTVQAFQGWLHASAAAGDKAPTVLVAANLDSFSAAPSLPGGANQNGSGAAALLELMRVFGRLYSEFRTHGAKNLLFVLTGAGTLDFAATRSWVAGVDPRVLEAVELVVCLDSLGGGGGGGLHMHYSKKPKTDAIRTLYGHVEAAAEATGVPLAMHQRKINIADPATPWQHEQFVRGARHLVAVTISGRAEAPEAGGNFGGAAGMFDRALDAGTLHRNVRFVAEALGRIVYDAQPGVASGVHGVSAEFLGSYSTFFASQPRSPLYLDAKSPAVAEVERVFRRHAADVARRAYPLDAEGSTFYTSSGATEVQMYTVKPFVFHVMQSVATVAYLAAIHFALRRFTSVFEAAGPRST